jgi:Rrf2 family protein
MRLTSATLYALWALVHLARHGGQGAVPSHALTGGLHWRYLLKALKALARAGVLHSVRGPGGGYRLARAAKRITLLEVVEAVEGPVRGAAPPASDTAEGRRMDARLQAVCDQAAEAVRRRLRRVSLADLAAE